MAAAKNTPPIIGISTGDLNGIGLEVILKTFADPRMCELCTPVIFANAKVVSYHRKACDLTQLHYQQISRVADAHSGKLNVCNIWDDNANIELGKLNPDNGTFAVMSIKACVDAFDRKEVDAIVTAPIHKEACYHETHFPFSGHTGFFADHYKQKALMLLCEGDFRVALVTDHIPLENVSQSIDQATLKTFITKLHDGLQTDFGVHKPRIAVLGLNPHAGDGGLIGDEDVQTIAPVVEALRNEGKLVFGPYPADGFFGRQNQNSVNAVVAMYHDQGLAPFKALSFGNGVNVTLGLPLVRTSPDHGTGFDIAGSNSADENSFRQAVYEAINIVKHRGTHRELTNNPLNVRPTKKQEGYH